MGSKGPRITDGAFGPPLFARDFAIGHIACGVTSQFAIFVSHFFKCSFPVSRPPPLRISPGQENGKEYGPGFLRRFKIYFRF
jgi:hypothetical protein